MTQKIKKINIKRWLLLVSIFYLFSRLLLIFFSPHIFHPDEIKEASLGIDLLSGRLKLPFWAYIDSPHSGGSIFFALTNIPFYLIFGENYFAQKMAALFFSFLLFFFLTKFFLQKDGKKTWLSLALLFLFPPSQYLRFSFFTNGNLWEPVFFIFINLYLINLIFIKKKTAGKNFFYLGICSGLGLWIQYLGLTTLATIFLIWFFRDKLFFWQKEFLIFLSGFLIGFSPFMIYNLSYDFASFNSDVVIHSGVFIQPLSESIVKLKNLLFVYLPHSFQLGNLLIFKANLTSWLVYLIFLFSVFF